MRTMKEETQVDRKGCQQVDDAEKTEYVFFRMFQAVDTCKIFGSEKEGQQIFQYSQYQVGRVRKNVHAFQYDQYHAEKDAAY